MNYVYKPSGVCSQKMEFEIQNNIIKDFKVIGGCSGNLEGIRSLIMNMDIDTVIEKLKGIKCGFKNTSCPNEISKALMEYKNGNNTSK